MSRYSVCLVAVAMLAAAGAPAVRGAQGQWPPAQSALRDSSGGVGPEWSNDPPQHQYMAYQSYLMLPDSPMKTEIGSYIGGVWHYTGDGDRGSSIAEGADEEDFVHNDLEIILGTARYFNHFWDPDGGYNAGINALGQHDSNVKTAEQRWAMAVALYPTDKPLAYWYLGRTIHLIQDACQPAHAHNDPHDDILNDEQMEGFGGSHYTEWNAQTKRPGSADELSRYPLTPADYEALPVQVANSGGIDYSQLGAARKTRLFRLFLNAAETADNFESERVNADTDAIQFNLPASAITWHPVGQSAPSPGEFTDAEMYLHADTLVPLAMSYGAGVMELFWDTTHPTMEFQLPRKGSVVWGAIDVTAFAGAMDIVSFTCSVDDGEPFAVGSVSGGVYLRGDRSRRFTLLLDTRGAGWGLASPQKLLFHAAATNASGFSAAADMTLQVDNRH